MIYDKSLNLTSYKFDVFVSLTEIRFWNSSLGVMGMYPPFLENFFSRDF